MNYVERKSDSRKSALLKYIAGACKGLSDSLAEKISDDLVDSGLTSSMSVMLIDTIYQTGGLRGSSNRLKWCSDAIKNRYGARLEKAGKSIACFRGLIADVEEAIEMRDALNAEAVRFSFQETFLLWELNYDSDTIGALLSNLISDGQTALQAKRAIIIAAKGVKAGQYQQIETGIEIYEADRTIRAVGFDTESD
jgi:hypothetical protein